MRTERLRGSTFETMIEVSNKTYQAKNIANIQKIATPVTIMKRNHNGTILGRLDSKSTVDFKGVAGGKAIAFDAKETRAKNKRFDLKMVHSHQIQDLLSFKECGGIAFLLINFYRERKMFRVDIDIIAAAYENWRRNPGKRGMASIHIEDIEKVATEVKSGRGCIIDYLKDIN